jgi:hypothetical protein
VPPGDGSQFVRCKRFGRRRPTFSNEREHSWTCRVIGSGAVPATGYPPPPSPAPVRHCGSARWAFPIRGPSWARTAAAEGGAGEPAGVAQQAVHQPQRAVPSSRRARRWWISCLTCQSMAAWQAKVARSTSASRGELRGVVAADVLRETCTRR